eukprot:641025-Pleurochrysis_carterae.AAC.1
MSHKGATGNEENDDGAVYALYAVGGISSDGRLVPCLATSSACCLVGYPVIVTAFKNTAY